MPRTSAPLLVTALPSLIPAAEPQGSVRVPLDWLLQHGSLPVRVRTILELGGVADRAVALAAYAHAPALRLAVQQSPDGTWGQRMLTVPDPADATFAGVGTIPAVRRLIEYGWEPESPTLHCARKLLFRLLAEDADPYYLYELRDDATDDEHTIRRGRGLVREGAAAALAQLGCEADPRLRGAASRMLERVSAHLRVVAAAEPGAESAASGALGVTAAPPSMHFLVMLAHMPRFRSEHQDEVHRLLTFLSAPAPEGVPKQLVGKREIAQPHLVLGDPLGAASASASAGPTRSARALPVTLAWLEVLARLGFLRRHGPWNALLDQLLVGRDLRGLWRARGDARGAPMRAWDWPTFPLGDPAEPDSWSADVTFRLALIARLAGRRLDFE